MNITARLLACIPMVLGVAAAASCSDESNGGNDGGDDSGGTGGITLGSGGTAGAAGSTTGGTGEEPLEACTGLEELADCGDSTQSARIKNPNILLVIDKSGSMLDPIDPDAAEPVTLWDGLRTALNDALANIDADMGIGLILYPYNTTATIPSPCSLDAASCCAVPDGADAVNVPMTKGADGVRAILGVLDNTPPGGGTPTSAALARALEYYTEGAGKDIEGEKYVLLATDGGPNCNLGLTCNGETCTTNIEGNCSSQNCCDGKGDRCLDDVLVRNQIIALKNAGIDTFVVGIPGTEDYAEYLNQFAIEGGRPDDGDTSYYAVSAAAGVEGLTAVFRDISTQLVKSCEIPLLEQPDDPEMVNVAVDCEIVHPTEERPVTTGGGGAGGGGSTTTETITNWHIDYTTPPGVLILEGELCEQVQTEGARRVDVTFGCPPIT